MHEFQDVRLFERFASDAVDGPVAAACLAMACAWLRESDVAMEQLTALARKPGGPDYGQLKLDPAWRDVRFDPRFQKMLVELERDPSKVDKVSSSQP